jgi:hypothetical protein
MPDIFIITILKAFILPAVLGVLYYVGLAVYRLYWSPLAAFPGPKLAALTTWYDFYYEIIKDGQFTFHIKDLHKEFGMNSLPAIIIESTQWLMMTQGPIIRISPNEFHINDPELFDQLYLRSGRRDKYTYMSRRFGYAQDTFSTLPHELHRVRRKSLSPLFTSPKSPCSTPMSLKESTNCVAESSFAGHRYPSIDAIEHLRISQKNVLQAFSSHVHTILEACPFTDFETKSTLAKSDRTPYEAIMDVLRHCNLNDSSFTKPTILRARSLWKKYDASEL